MILDGFQNGHLFSRTFPVPTDHPGRIELYPPGTCLFELTQEFHILAARLAPEFQQAVVTFGRFEVFVPVGVVQDLDPPELLVPHLLGRSQVLPEFAADIELIEIDRETFPDLEEKPYMERRYL